jgi:hypothetical protein
LTAGRLVYFAEAPTSEPFRGSVLIQHCFSPIANRAPGGIQAIGQRPVRDDASVPDGADEIVPAYDALPILDQINK